jgi:hypothetical protein
MLLTRWKTSYTDIAHANEEVISDNVRKAHRVILLAWVVTILIIGLIESTQEAPSATIFLYNAIATTVCMGAFYLALVGLRYFAHAKPNAWHAMNWGAIWLFLIGVTAYFAVNEGNTVNTIIAGATLISVYAYRWMMHRATVWWEITPIGVSEHIKFLGHTQSAHTTWKEVKGHWVHPLSGAVQLRLRFHGFHFHIKPHVFLIVPDKRNRKKIHAVLAKILKTKTSKKRRR